MHRDDYFRIPSMWVSGTRIIETFCKKTANWHDKCQLRHCMHFIEYMDGWTRSQLIEIMICQNASFFGNEACTKSVIFIVTSVCQEFTENSWLVALMHDNFLFRECKSNLRKWKIYESYGRCNLLFIGSSEVCLSWLYYTMNKIWSNKVIVPYSHLSMIYDSTCTYYVK